MTREKFIIECSQKILANMMANPEKVASAEAAVSYAEELWEELAAKGIVDGHLVPAAIT